MQQHPVPQHIASYEFRLVGDMTLRQFGMLAVCCLIALIFYASGLPAYFKWPIVIFFVFLGVGLAFFPINERPLHQWLIAFFKAVYSPTQFIWKKQPQKLALFETTTAKPKTPLVQPKAAAPDRSQLSQYLQTLPTEQTPLEKKEETFLNKVDNLFKTTSVPTPLPTTPVTPTVMPQVAPSPPTTPTPPPSTPPPSSPLAPVPSKPVPSFKEPAKPVFKKEPPKTRPTVVKSARIVIPQPPSPPSQPKEKKPRQPRPPIIKFDPQKGKTAVQAKISSQLPFPQTPQTPNLLVGMALDNQGKIVEGAIVEIRNSQGMPVRALKTNRLGQFRIATPLKNDLYEIETDKEDYNFDILKVELKGEPVPPIEIRAK